MSLELLLQRFVLPFFCSMIGCFILASTDQGDDFYDDEPTTRTFFRTLLGVLICGTSVIASDFWSRGILQQPNEWLNWSPSYQWQWMFMAVPASMLAMAITSILFSIPNQFAAAGNAVIVLCGVGILFLCLNEGEVWNDQQHKLLPSFAVGLVAIVCNSFSLNYLATSGAMRWVPLVLVGQLGCVAAIVLQTYGSLGELCLIGISVAFGASTVAMAKGTAARLHFGWPICLVVLPIAVMATGCLVVSQFFEVRQIPLWLLASVLFLPAMIGLIDWIFGRHGNVWMRAMVGAICCAIILGLVLYWAPPVEVAWIESWMEELHNSTRWFAMEG